MIDPGTTRRGLRRTQTRIDSFRITLRWSDIQIRVYLFSVRIVFVTVYLLVKNGFSIILYTQPR